MMCSGVTFIVGISLIGVDDWEYFCRSNSSMNSMKLLLYRSVQATAQYGY